jgi:hypothetical protein
LWAKGLSAKDIHKEMFLVYGQKCLPSKAIHKWVKNLPPWCKRLADDEEVEMKVRKWLRQQPKDFYAAGFNVLVKRWEKYINVGGGYVKK